MIHIRIIFSLLLIAGSLSSFAQDSKRQNEKRLYRSILNIDSSKAELIWSIQNNYKANLGIIMGDTTLGGGRRERKVRALMESRNKLLKSHLSDTQLEKIVSPTERVITASERNQ